MGYQYFVYVVVGVVYDGVFFQCYQCVVFVGQLEDQCGIQWFYKVYIYQGGVEFVCYCCGFWQQGVKVEDCYFFVLMFYYFFVDWQ